MRSLLVAFAVLLVSPPARAERPNDAATLDYLPSPATAPLCPAADFLALEVQIRLGYELFQPSAPDHLTVKVDRTNGRFRAIGEMRDDAGKVIFAVTHSEIDCTAALVSMAISVSFKFTRPPEPSEPSPPAPLPPAPAPALPPPPIASPLVPERHRFQAGIASVVSIGIAPTVVGGAGLFLGMRWPRASLAIEGRALLAPSVRFEQATVRDGYHLLFAAISSTACYHLAWASMCGRVEAGNLSFSNPAASFAPSRMSVLGFGFRLGAERALTPWLAIRAYADMMYQPFTSVLRNQREGSIIWTQPQIFGSVGLGPAFTFPGI